jgi:hypothetical protein
MKMLLGDLNTEVGKEDIFKPTVQNKSLHEINNDRWQLVTQLLTDQNTQHCMLSPQHCCCNAS